MKTYGRGRKLTAEQVAAANRRLTMSQGNLGEGDIEQPRQVLVRDWRRRGIVLDEGLVRRFKEQP